MLKLFVPKIEDEVDVGNKLTQPVRFPNQMVDQFLDIKDFAVETLIISYLKADFTGQHVTHSIGGQSYCTFDRGWTACG